MQIISWGGNLSIITMTSGETPEQKSHKKHQGPVSPEFLRSMRSSFWVSWGAFTAIRTDSFPDSWASLFKMVSPYEQSRPSCQVWMILRDVPDHSCSRPDRLLAHVCQCRCWWGSSRTRRCQCCSEPHSLNWARSGRWRDDWCWN